MFRRAFVGFAVILALVSVKAQGDLAGRWSGAIAVMGQKLDIVVTFTGEGDAMKGAIDIPQQGAAGLPLVNLKTADRVVHFELQAGPGIAVFHGERDGDRIAGTFRQGVVEGSFEITRTGAAAGATPPPEPALPYEQEHVQTVNGDVTLAGTLTLPPGPGPHPAVVLITGSGAQDRDENVFGMRVFGLLADHLTRAGIAVLRSDDRGVGGSTGNLSQSTSADFAGDALAQVQLLRSRKEIDPKRIGLIGHSEGGIIAPMAANRSADIAFVVLLSGPALSGEQIMLAQNELIGRASGVPEERIRKNGELQRKIFAAVKAGESLDPIAVEAAALTREALAQLPEAQRKAIGDLDAAAAKAGEQAVASAKSPWFRFFLQYDPAPALERLKVPVLAIFGERDTQVPAEPNRRAMEAAFAKGGRRDHTIIVFPRANHLYQEAVTGGPAEYGTLEKKFAPGFAETISKWILAKTRKG